MNLEEAIKWVDSTLEAKTGKKLTIPEKEILKAAWDNEPYNAVADSLYMSVGHIKDLASLLWKRLSDLLDEKVTKNNFRHLLLQQSATSTQSSLNIVENDTYQTEDRKGNILIVDDLIENLHFLNDILSKQGYKVRSVTNGNMALRTIRNNPPDVILLDIKMPDIDGYQVCSILKAEEEISDIPIIFLSALNEVFDKVKAFEVGGVDYITKPFQTEEVIARIQTHLTLQQQKAQLRQEIEKHQQTAEILYQSRAILASLLNSSRDGIAAMQAVRDMVTGEIEDFRYLLVNPVFAKILGKKREELTNNLGQKQLLNQLIPGFFKQLVQVVETGESLEQEFFLETKLQKKGYELIAVKLGDGFSMTIREVKDYGVLGEEGIWKNAQLNYQM
ncbi:two-component response regulator [Tolypothrix tenuis PCC 7101]|uniref:Two-component response regulator n=1 Tax=Tolypothrix tenuis PCC 7101 TaxID=231146 RepID=A0A1Z4N5F5_9CYAN|nr:response regulator [Aulosira sp. FACHB-113]BAZ00934.1 two-component response regulator [Tolypothrix tenuis PCC 7101]BAZ75143.1 two-component response regulator [Aulosira laxa NIES-50]